MADQPRELTPGTLFHGRYEIVRRIRAGGMGAVYEVIHLETRRRRALKVMLPSIVADPDLRNRFRIEATVAADIRSEHIVETFDAGVDAETGTPFLVMELLEGEDLGQVLKRRGRFEPDEVVTLLTQAARVLERTHAAGIIHRDLKPENLFLTQRDDGSPHLKILDFGIAKVISAGTAKMHTQSLGTPLYMPREQMRGDKTIGPATDTYALAHIAYTLLVGEAYWATEKQTAENAFALLLQISEGMREPPNVRAARRAVFLPAGFNPWFYKATATLPEERYGRAMEAVSALAFALGVQAPPASAQPSSLVRQAEAIPAAPRQKTITLPPAPPPGSPSPSQTPSPQAPPAPATAVSASGNSNVTPPPWAPSGPSTAGASAGSFRILSRGQIVAIGLLGAIVGSILLFFVAAAVGVGSPPPAEGAKKHVVNAVNVKQLKEATKLFEQNDVEGAHKKLLEIPEDVRPTETDDFKKIEDAWAERRFKQVGETADPVKKKALLKEIMTTETVSARMRTKAADMIREIGGSEAPPASPAPSSTTVLPAQGRPDEEALRKQLEPKVWGGRGTLEEIRMLKAICSHMGDAACRNRAAEETTGESRRESPPRELRQRPRERSG